MLKACFPVAVSCMHALFKETCSNLSFLCYMLFCITGMHQKRTQDCCHLVHAHVQTRDETDLEEKLYRKNVLIVHTHVLTCA